MEAAPHRSLAALSALDWIGVAATVLLLGALVFVGTVVARDFLLVFREVGGTLPGLTEVVATGRPALAGGGFSFLLLSLALLPDRRLGLRRVLVVAAFSVAGLALAASVIGLYLPFMTLSAQVQP